MIVDSYSEYSLNELEGPLEEVVELKSGLVQQCLAARKKKIKDLSVNDCRILLTQKMGLDYITPVALEILEVDPLVSSGLYKGDLLVAVLKIPEKFWCKNPDLNNRLMEIKIDVEEVYNTLSVDIFPLMKSIDFK